MTETATSSYGLDENKKEILLKGAFFQVMMEWEKPYIEACIDTLQPKNDVLEVGFGLGYAASAIQKYHPTNHTIVEGDLNIIQKAKQWIGSNKNIRIVEDIWQKALPTLGIFDTIFFHDYAAPSEKELQELELARKKVGGKLEEIRVLKDTVESALKEFEGAKFTDEDLQIFGAELLTRPGVPLQDVINFVYSLVVSEHISADQAEKFISEFKSRVAARKKEESFFESRTNSNMLSEEFVGNRLVVFIEMCLNNNMRAGSKISAFLSSPQETQKKEFRERILSRKDIRFSEKLISVDVPANCTYYKGNQALVILIEKI